jgi:hypothetical protein
VELSSVSLAHVLYTVQKSHFAHALAESNHMLVAMLQIIHVFGFIFLLSPLILIVLRVFGLVLRDQPLQETLRQPRALSLAGLAVTLASGLLMFLTAPLHYYNNWAFDTKMLLLLASLTIYAVLFLGMVPRQSAHPNLVKVTVVVSVVLWLGVCMAARAIGFVA